MPSPRFTFRMPASDRIALEEMAKLYGAASAGGFLAEMVGCMCSGDPRRVQQFNTKLVHAVGEQLILKLNAPFAPEPAIPSKKRPVKRRVRVKGAKPHARP